MSNIAAKTSSNVFYKVRSAVAKCNDSLSSREGAADIMSIDRGDNGDACGDGGGIFRIPQQQQPAHRYRNQESGSWRQCGRLTGWKSDRIPSGRGGA